MKGKYIKKNKKDAKRSTGILQIIHTDICDPFPVKSMDGYDSFITFTDDYSRYNYIEDKLAVKRHKEHETAAPQTTQNSWTIVS
jgi:hypothetical protein